jgi:hypothetical protein
MVRPRSDLLLTMKPGFRRKTMPVEVWEDEIQNLQLGEWRELNSGDEILSTLDQNAKQRGLRFCRRCTILWATVPCFEWAEKISVQNTSCVRSETRPASAGITNPVLLEGEICNWGRYWLIPSLPSFLVRSMAAEGSPPHSWTKRARPKYHILSHASVFIACQITACSVISLSSGLTT